MTAGGYENVLLKPTNKEELSLLNQECQKASFQEKSMDSKDPYLERTSGLQIRGFNALHLAAKHIPGKHNVAADHLSRFKFHAAFSSTPLLNRKQTLIPVTSLVI